MGSLNPTLPAMDSVSPSIPLSYYRGGTSKALFFHAHDVPPPGKFRDRLLIRLMGSPDPMQIDGMGGTHIVTSKIAIISPPTAQMDVGTSTDMESDVEYTFAQVGVKEAYIDYGGNCGNISSAVGVFAIREGLLDHMPFREGKTLIEKGRAREVRVWNTGTKKRFISHVPVDPKSGRVLEKGGYHIDGCPGTGAPILMDYKDVIGAVLNRGALPTGSAIDSTTITAPDGKEVKVDFSICDVANPIVFAPASSIGLTLSGSEPSAQHLTEDDSVVAAVRELRGKAAQLLGMCSDWKKVDNESPMLPMVALVASPSNAGEGGGDVQSRLFLDNKCHTSMAGTGAICHAACSRIPGTVVNKMLRGGSVEKKVLDVRHPGGIMPAAVEVKNGGAEDGEEVDFETLSFVRTARRIFKGEIDVPEDMWEEWDEWKTSEGRNGRVNGHT